VGGGSGVTILHKPHYKFFDANDMNAYKEAINEKVPIEKQRDFSL
jgi:hypothetical protein